MKVRMDIDGIDCPHCAAKLESLMQKEFGDANLNFAMGSLVVDTTIEDEEAVLEKALSIARNFEDGISIELRD
jgi:hypothetical protein